MLKTRSICILAITSTILIVITGRLYGKNTVLQDTSPQNPAVAEFTGWVETGGVEVITGNFDGVGGTDIALVRREPGWATVPVALSDPFGFTIQNREVGEFAGWTATPGVEVITGDFDGDGGTDIALVRREPGWATVPVALSSPTGFTIQNRPVGEFADWAAIRGVEVITGDFDGDRRTDIALVRQTAGWATVPVALSSPTGFTIQNRPVGEFAGWAATGGVQVITGDFTGRVAGTDIALVRKEPGWATVPVAVSNPLGFTIENRPVGEFAGWAATGGVQIITGDFDGNGFTDIGLVRQTPGWTTVPVALSDLFGFTIQNRPVGEFARWAATGGVQIITGSFDLGRTDIGLVRQAPGWTTVPVALSSATDFTIQNRPVGEFAGWAATTGVTLHRLQIRRFTTANLFDAEADAILSDATTVLQTNDGAGDVACPVTFSRDGDAIPFTNGDGSIDSQAEFAVVIGVPGSVKVVNQINWCSILQPNIIGCAPTPGNSLAVVRTAANIEGILWAHEFGHNKNLPDLVGAPNSIMNGIITATSQRVTMGECNAFSTPSMSALLAQTRRFEQRDLGLMDVRDFVRQVFIRGVPYEEASNYDASVVPTLLDMLNDPAEQAHWANIVVVLGMIGDEVAVDSLIAFIEVDYEDNLSREQYAAKTSALMALGYLINKTGNQNALAYLVDSLAPETWVARDVAGIAPFQASTSERNQDFSKHAILGLALSGHPQAAQALRYLQQPAATETQRAFQDPVTDLVSEALKEHEKIARQGLAGYYRTRQP